jgi:hypothetical protein
MMTKIGELGTTLAITSNRSKLQRNTLRNTVYSTKKPVLPRTTRRNIPEDGILLSPPWESQILHSINRVGSLAEISVSCEV